MHHSNYDVISYSLLHRKILVVQWNAPFKFRHNFVSSSLTQPLEWPPERRFVGLLAAPHVTSEFFADKKHAYIISTRSQVHASVQAYHIHTFSCSCVVAFKRLFLESNCHKFVIISRLKKENQLVCSWQNLIIRVCKRWSGLSSNTILNSQIRCCRPNCKFKRSFDDCCSKPHTETSGNYGIILRTLFIFYFSFVCYFILSILFSSMNFFLYPHPFWFISITCCNTFFFFSVSLLPPLPLAKENLRVTCPGFLIWQSCVMNAPIWERTFVLNTNACRLSTSRDAQIKFPYLGL